MKKTKGKYIKFIVTLISVGIFVYSYLVVCTGYMNKTTEAYKEVEQIKLLIREREIKLEQEEDILQEVDKINKQKQDIIDQYPVHIAKEDNFMFVEKMQEALKIELSSLNVSDNTGFYNTILPAVVTEEDSEDDANDKMETMNGVVNTINMNFLTDYEGFKELSEYVRNYPEPTVIDNVAVSYDSSTGALAGNLTLKRFALNGTGKEYKGTPIDDINIGIDNLFGTGSPEKSNSDIDNEAGEE